MTGSLSIITIAKNDLLNLEKTFESVNRQSNRSAFSYIILDGESDDGSCEFILKNASLIDKYIIESDAGIYDAMNNALGLVYSEWILFLNAGDILVSHNTIEEFISNLDNEADVVFGDVFVAKGSSIKKKVASDLKYFNRRLPFSHQAAFIRSSVHHRYLYSTQFSIASDYEVFLRMFRDGVRFKHVDQFVSVISDGGISDRERIKARREIAIVSTNLLPSLANRAYHVAAMILELGKKIFKRYVV